MTLSRIFSFKITIIFRISAVRATIGFFPIIDQPFIELSEGWVVACGDHRGPEQQSSDFGSSATNTAIAFERSAIFWVRCKTGECGGLAAGHVPEFWHEGGDPGGNDGTYTRHGAHGIDTCLQGLGFLNEGFDLFVECRNLAFQAANDRLQGTGDRGALWGLQPVLFGDPHGDQIHASEDKGLQRLALFLDRLPKAQALPALGTITGQGAASMASVLPRTPRERI